MVRFRSNAPNLRCICDDRSQDLLEEKGFVVQREGRITANKRNDAVNFIPKFFAVVFGVLPKG